ncbi:cyclin-D5-2-like isoform X1 [Nymphaea colorata]|nr:cyclin-D5-2-like isoform X1 [Nymphaea colorata]
MGDSDAVSLSILLCGESESCLNDCDGDDEFVAFLLRGVDFSETEDEFIGFMVEKEGTFLKSQDCVVINDENWMKCARLEAIRWIKKRKDYFDFGSETAYLSVTYMDRFLSRRTMDKAHGWAMQLLSIACLSLAAKMEECRIPPLPEFQGVDYGFSSDIIQRMELLVLNTLEWRLYSVTPFCYLNYFITKFGIKSKRDTSMCRAIDLILGIVEVMNTTEHRPSTIAAAAVLASSGQKFSRKAMDLKMGSVSACFTETEGVFSCYNIMQGLEIGSWRTPTFAISPDLSSIYPSPCAKRRRLLSGDYSHGSCVSDEKRPD